MRKIFLVLFTIILVSTLFTTTAEARRFGGGRSFGMQRSINPYSRPKMTSMNQTSAFKSRSWLAPLAGGLMGGIIGSLLMGHGFGTGILTWLALGTVVLLLLRLLRPRQHLQYQASTNHAYHMNHAHYDGMQPSSSKNHRTFPINFDEHAFLREAKVQFLRLQSASDSNNLADIREFTTPEVFAEIQLQLQERGNKHHHTVIDLLDAELVEFSSETLHTIATVRFSGRIREDNIPSTLNEIWHFRKEGFHWLVCGVQQA